MKTVFLAILSLQICLDRRGFSPNAMDGQTGAKTRAALAAYCAANGLPPPAAGEEEFAFEKYFPGESDLFTTVEVTAAELKHLINDTITYIWGLEDSGFDKPEFGYDSRKALLEKLKKFEKEHFPEFACSCGERREDG
jgi:peptidoglycan hydrolase-like protein with peptidoglycan-binding domain